MSRNSRSEYEALTRPLFGEATDGAPAAGKPEPKEGGDLAEFAQETATTIRLLIASGNVTRANLSLLLMYAMECEAREARIAGSSVADERWRLWMRQHYKAMAEELKAAIDAIDKAEPQAAYTSALDPEPLPTRH